MDEQNKTAELHETELEKVAGGSPTANRYDPQRCGSTNRTIYECVGFIRAVYCDHYRVESFNHGEYYRFTCRMGRYDYYGDWEGNPLG